MGLLVGLSLAFAVTFVVAIPLVWLTFAIAAVVGRIERSRAAALLDVNLGSPHPPMLPGNWWSRMRQRLTSGSRWREIGYLVVGLPAMGFLGFVVLGTWVVSLTLVALPTYVGHLAGRSADVLGVPVHGAWSILGLAIGLVGLVAVAPWATVGLVAVDRWAVGWLLGPSRPGRKAWARLQHRVGELEVSRGAAVDRAEADRRQIERDLHDGAQQRLVALAMDLGRARDRFDSDPERARQLLEEAHEEAKAALSELRNLARGIHPAVLTDRGLDAALSAVVTRCPVPVTLTVDVPARPPAAVESAAYFVVAEALTNVAKHARASRADVTIALVSNRLVVEVRDDGIGGAILLDPAAARGTGLAGLSERVSALGGWVRVLSPVQGPTSVVVELPCGS